jgi:Patatin-like phospholipase
MSDLGIEHVLRAEAMALHPHAALDGKSDRELNIALSSLRSAALCFSGGGIRSAAFCLGVIQALASRPALPAGAADSENCLLAKFHYLSTVSGGGYIGSWLSAWLSRNNFAEVRDALVNRAEAPNIEPQPLSWLRRYGNYLTPKLGLMSADAWADVAIVVRNMILNWLVIVPWLCLLVLLLKGAAVIFIWLGQIPPSGQVEMLGGNFAVSTPFLALAYAGISLLIVALTFATINRPTRGASKAGQTPFLWLDLLPALFGAFLLTVWPVSQWAYGEFRETSLATLTLKGAIYGAVIYACAWILAYALDLIRRRGRWHKASVDLFLWAVAGGVYGAVMALGVYLFFTVYDGFRATEVVFYVFRNQAILLFVLGVPWALLAQLFAEMIFVGLSSYETESDGDREWLGRAAGWLAVCALGWLVVTFLVLLGSELLATLSGEIKKWLSAGLVSGGATALLGKSRHSPASADAPQNVKSISTNLALAIAAPVFGVSLVILASALLDKALFGGSLLSQPFAAPQAFLPGHTPPIPSAAFWLALALAIAVGVGLLASLTVNINRFSLHALYRNRLVRAFLGATNPDRSLTRNPFTDFDERDNPRVHQLWPHLDGQRRLFHVINIALNIVATRNLAWQERKAESFTVSPLHSGSACLAYRPSESYGHKDQGISLGTAMAISGAAASPNMGYHSSPAVTFLLALFNVRLGWWLGNPRKNTYTSEGPGMAIGPLLNEAFGLTTDDRRYVYLSDGGHFENLALYEMVRRRCTFILVVDAGCDPKHGFEDLGNAVRKIEIDLGVRIRFHGLDRLEPRSSTDSQPGARPYSVKGVIDYPAADRGGVQGTILYVKPGFHGTEGAGIRAYAVAHPDFPHESTGDQWFGESQFESYRSLGFEIIDGILAAGGVAFGGERPASATGS